MTVGDRIRQVRIEKDITQQELADCAGVSKQAVYKKGCFHRTAG